MNDKKNSLIKLDPEYTEWLRSVSNRFRQSQIMAAMKVNDEMLRFYWSLGRDISEMHAEAKYGSGFYATVSADLKDIFPEVHSFSVTNLKYMQYFYEMYPDAENRPRSGDELPAEKNRPQLGDIFRIPWGHQKLILDKCKEDADRALFYAEKTLENNWSRASLLNFLDTDLYERQGKAITNFKATLPAAQSDLAQSITRDPYNFDFLTIREQYDEKELKDAMMENVKEFLLELGTGFSFVGREYILTMGEKENFIDMLFFNIRLRCYVVLEVKVTEFDSSFAGKLGTYVVAVNHQLKEDWMNPTIGLLVCKGLNKVEAQYALESTSQPIGVSSYELSRLIPEEFKGSLPTIEEIEAELQGVGDTEVEQNGK